MSTVERDGAVGAPQQGGHGRTAADRNYMSAAERGALVVDDAETVQLRTITVPEAFVRRTEPDRADPAGSGPDAGPEPGAADGAPA
ncbi:MAG: hypothetical protein HOY76_04745, partial [Streptomyces sp.]|nr:hypothetical protein [Streptomyces sp.]NUS13628.1 hypothetical protein [Streptomyces sp.]